MILQFHQIGHMFFFLTISATAPSYMVHETGLSSFFSFFQTQEGVFSITGLCVKPDVLAQACYCTQCGLRDRLLLMNQAHQPSAQASLCSLLPLCGLADTNQHLSFGFLTHSHYNMYMFSRCPTSQNISYISLT